MILLRRGILLAAACGLAVFYFFIDPATSPPIFPCMLKLTTGWSCWGCGGQRAFHNLLHGHFEEAFGLNALVFPIVLLSAYMLQAELRGLRRPYDFLRSRYVQVIALLIVVGFTIWRNVA